METQHGKLKLSNYVENLAEYDNSRLEKVKFDSEEAYDRFIAYNFVQGPDHSRTEKTREDLYNQFYLVINSYIWNLTNAANMIINYKNYVNN